MIHVKCCCNPQINGASVNYSICTAGTTDILSREPPFIKCFDPLFPEHSQDGGSAVVISHYVSVVSFQLFSSFFIHSQLDDLSAAVLSLPTAFFLFAPVMPNEPYIFHSDRAGKPLVPTSTGKSHVIQPHSLHCSMSSEYLARFLLKASSQLVSQGTVNSTVTRRFSFLDQMTKSGLRLVCTISGKISFFLRSTDISHCSDSLRMDVEAVFCLVTDCPSFTN